MTLLCKKFFPHELAALQDSLINPTFRSNPGLCRAVTYSKDQDAEEEEDGDETQQDESEEEDGNTHDLQSVRLRH